MSKPYLVIEIIEGKMGAVKECPTFDEAVGIATEMAAEQTTIPKEVIREEIESAANWIDETGNISVNIAQAD
jgi:hypothetical protein